MQPSPAVRPSILEVANLMPDRTTIQGGSEAGTFNTQTRPTGTQVDQIIDLVLDALDPRLAEQASTETQRGVRAITALTAAILTEVTYFSHQGDVSEQRIAVWEKLIDQYTLAILGDPATESTGADSLKVGTVRWSTDDPSVYGIVSLDVVP